MWSIGFSWIGMTSLHPTTTTNVKVLYLQIGRALGKVCCRLVEQKEIEIEEGHLLVGVCSGQYFDVVWGFTITLQKRRAS